VTLGAAINGALPFLQAQAASMQTQHIKIVDNGSLQALEPDHATGIVTPQPTTIYDGPGRVKPLKRITAGGTDVGSVKASESVFIISLPHSAVGIKPGHIAHVTSSSDPDLLIDTFRVVIVEDSEQTTARRLTCELVESRQP
jgi:hypothetical protein